MYKGQQAARVQASTLCTCGAGEAAGGGGEGWVREAATLASHTLIPTASEERLRSL